MGTNKSTKKKKGPEICCVVLIVIILIAAVVISIGVAAGLHQLHKDKGVRTSVGRIRGQQVAAPGELGNVDEYLGIPYAEPPVNQYRFSNPVALTNLPQGSVKGEDPFEATSIKGHCIGNLKSAEDGTSSEDCLYLNIWVPSSTKGKLSVMIWINGEDFEGEYDNLYQDDARTLAAFGEIIVISINYRVGLFGFLVSRDETIKGNLGMRDQVMALQWINDNIEAFGGNADKITIFGQGSGAASAGLHMMSPLSKHLFSRVIQQTGSAESTLFFMDRATASARSDSLLEAVNCSTEDTKAQVECIREVSLQVLLHHDKQWTWPSISARWGPTVDGIFLTKTPQESIKQRVLHKKESIIGTSDVQSEEWISKTLDEISKSDVGLKHFSEFVDIINADLSADKRAEIKDMYEPGDPSNVSSFRPYLIKQTVDRHFRCPVERLADAYGDSSTDTYLYRMAYRSEIIKTTSTGASEFQFVFGLPLEKYSDSTDEVGLSEALMIHWYRFAKYGDPERYNLHWPRYSTSEQSYLNIWNASSFQPDLLQGGLNHCDFWNAL